MGLLRLQTPVIQWSPNLPESHLSKNCKKKKIHITHDTWHLTCDTWWGGEHSLKISASLLLQFVIYDVLKIWRKRLTRSLNTKVFVEGICRTAPGYIGSVKNVLVIHSISAGPLSFPCHSIQVPRGRFYRLTIVRILRLIWIMLPSIRLSGEIRIWRNKNLVR